MNGSDHSSQNDSIACSLNGEQVELNHRSLMQLLLAHGLKPDQSGVAVALNDMVVRRGDWESTELSDGDRIEVITAMQGG